MMPDYHSFPLWGMDSDNFGNINPNSLNLSQHLIKQLTCWAKQYDDTLNLDDPLKSGFSDESAEVAFTKMGEILLEKLKMELGDDYCVILKI